MDQVTQLFQRRCIISTCMKLGSVLIILAQWLNHPGSGISRTADGKPPWKATIKQHLLPDTELLEFVCGQNLDTERLVGK